MMETCLVLRAIPWSLPWSRRSNGEIHVPCRFRPNLCTKTGSGTSTTTSTTTQTPVKQSKTQGLLIQIISNMESIPWALNV